MVVVQHGVVQRRKDALEGVVRVHTASSNGASRAMSTGNRVSQRAGKPDASYAKPERLPSCKLKVWHREGVKESRQFHGCSAGILVLEDPFTAVRPHGVADPGSLTATRLCSPAYAAELAQALAGPAAGWSGLTFLDLLRPNEGWATWEDWFAPAGGPAGTPRRLGLDSHTYVLEAVATGSGAALGWRQFIERFLEAGTLVPLGGGFFEFDRAYYGVLTGKGRRKPLARRCLEFFDLDRNQTASR